LTRAKATVDSARYQAYRRAADLMRGLMRAEKFVEFLTVPAYAQLVASERAKGN
jgi:malate synthase